MEHPIPKQPEKPLPQSQPTDIKKEEPQPDQEKHFFIKKSTVIIIALTAFTLAVFLFSWIYFRSL